MPRRGNLTIEGCKFGKRLQGSLLRPLNLTVMPNTFSQIYLQFVFAVKGRQSLVPKQHKEELHKYMTGLVQNRKAKMLAVHCMPDHTHLFVGFKPSDSLSRISLRRSR